jgi:ATP-dependent protease Clp ATPase subunit
MIYFKSKTVHSWSSANQLLNEVEQDMTNYQLKPDVINRSRMLRLITQTEGLIFLHILRKPNPINVSLFKDQ